MTVAEMRRRMTSAEFAAWIAFDRLSPIGDRRVDIHFARLMALVAAGLTGRRTRADQFDVFSEASFNRAVEPAADLESQKALARRITRMLGGTVTGT